ncbi:ATP-binding response regulator [Bradyrhizobium guangdongense]
MAAHFRAAWRKQPNGSGIQSDPSRADLVHAKFDAVAAERIRALYRSHTSRFFFLGFSTLGAILVALLCLHIGRADWIRVLLWLGGIAGADICLSLLDRSFRHNAPKDNQLLSWAWARAIASGARALAWSSGPILMYQHGDIVSLIVPLWGIINLTAASAYTAAPFLPSLIATGLAGILPAACWLLAQGTDVTRLGAALLLLALPFVGFLGVLGRRNITALIEGRLELAGLLERQQLQTRLVEDAMTERTRFFTSVSHDLKQPLQALSLYAPLLLKAKDDGSRRDIAMRVIECVTTLERQFSAILKVADIDASLRQARPAPISLQALFVRLADQFRPDAEAKGLRLKTVATSLWCWAPSDLLERVLLNLLSNAVKYTRQGTILLGARKIGRAVRICVVDTGIGISQEEQLKIFDEFYQVGNSGRARELGYGLGLSIVRRLCTGMQWPVACKSAVGRGSLFSVEVPRAERAPRSPTGLDASTDLQSTMTQKVVIVEDDALVEDALTRLLTNWGISVLSCRNEMELLEVLQSSPPDALPHVLLDHRLGNGATGLDLADQVGKSFGNRVHLTLMTAETDKAVMDGAARRNIVVLRKPIKPIRLRAILRAHTAGANIKRCDPS